VTEAEPLEEVTGVEEDLRLDDELVDPEFAELLDAVELVEPAPAVVVVTLVPEVPEPEVPPVETTVAADRCEWPENEAAAAAEKIPVRAAAPATPIRVRRRIRFTPSSRELVLFGDIRFPF
jgi:hypothetical protein